MQPDVSFVIAAFNAERSIARAIESALAQRDVIVEVVVVDDCSSDRTVAAAGTFPPEQVRVVELDRNRGPGGARNAGLEAARGRWIAVLDSDDAVYPGRLARMIRRAERFDARIAVDNLDVVQEASGAKTTMFAPNFLERFPELVLADFIAANLLFEETFSFGYMKPIFERRFVEEHGLRYDETLRIGEDYVFLASALAKGGRCIVEPRAGYAYHIRSGSISRVLELHHVEAMLAADAAFLREHGLNLVARAAQARRTRSLEQAASFLTLVQHLKQRAPLKAMRTALRDPGAVRHLKMPIAARLRRLGASFNSARRSIRPDRRHTDLGGGATRSNRDAEMKKVRKAVIPVAGLGTRFLPATKAMPKEMLTVVDRPVVQYAVDEALEAGIEHIVFVTGRNKHVIEDYFDIQPELEDTLTRSGKHEQLASLRTLQLPAGAVSFTRQQAPHGLGHAVWCARDIVGEEPFALLLPDMVSFGKTGCLAGAMELYGRTGGNVIAVEQCDPTETGKYGIVGKGQDVGTGFAVTGMVEKPAPAVAPSNYYINGRYVLQPELFELLGTQERGAGNEIQLTDAMKRLAHSQPFHAHPFDGRMFDCGSKEGFIQANVAFALGRADMRDLVFEPIAEMMAAGERSAEAA